MIFGGLIGALGFFLKGMSSNTASEQLTTRKEIRDIMIEVGRLEKALESLEKDVDAIGGITRELRSK